MVWERNITKHFDSYRVSGRFSPCLVLVAFMVCISKLMAQNYDEGQGYYPVTNYSHEESPGHFQNWFITQDHEGFIYAANGSGILEFDGVDWRLIASPGLAAVRTVVVDSLNRKWVGADRELGYLEPDSLGFLQYKSLKDKIPSTHPLTANIWQIFPEKDRVIFAADNAIFSWQDNKFQIIPHPGPIYREYQINGEVYFNIRDQGMFVVKANTLQPIPNGDLLKDVQIIVAIPYDDSSVLFVSRANGLFVYDGETVTKFDNEVDEYLKENSRYAARRLTDSTYAFATLRGGVIIMDKKGKRVGTVTTKDGILNDQVHGLEVDSNGALWLALQTGISQIGVQLPYTIFDKRAGLTGTVSTVLRHNGRLYVGTFDGLYVLEDERSSDRARFQRLEGINSGCFSLTSSGKVLLAATGGGVFSVVEKDVREIRSLGGTRALYRSRRDTNRIFVGHMHGLSTLYLKNGQWQHERDIEQIKEDIFTVTADEEGVLWLGSSLHQAIRIEFPEQSRRTPNEDIGTIRISKFQKGLPKGPTNLYLINGELLMTTDGEGGPLFKLNGDTGEFAPETRFGERFGLDSLSIYPIAYQNSGQHILLASKSEDGQQYRFSATKTENGYSVKRVYDEYVRGNTQLRAFWDNNGYLWSGDEGIVKYDLRSDYNFKPHFRTAIRKVTIGQDSVVFGGNSDLYQEPILKYSIKGLRFEYAAPNILGPSKARYQYRLEGLDPEWSNWTKETQKDYTNLPEGEYRFSARARNIYGDISLMGSFDFEILPPWYRTWWAFLLYVLLFVGFLAILLKWRSRQLKAKNEALEKLVELRTSEVRLQASQLRIQAEKLKELDKAKSRFFANISHEFRTPLTLIKGPIEQLERNFDEKMSLETVKMIRRNANRVLNMVNQLLDLSKFDEGSLKLVLTEGDVYKCIRAATSSFNSHAAQRDIDYKVQIPSEVLWASFDRDKLENIIYNLLGNAFKFSEDGSQISFKTTYDATGLQVRVADSGSGIPKEKLPYIFDRFYQVDGGSTREKGGSGIGLSLSKDLVELMDGTITVSSEVNKGTCFIVQLPIEEIKMGITPSAEEGFEHENAVPKSPFEFTKADERDVATILLVEDNQDMRQFIKEQLVKHYKVIEATNGELGLKKAISNPPDLIITDLMMPKIDGIEFCNKLKTNVNTSHIPVIMLTAKAGIDNKLKGLETGADDYLTKPFNAKELLARTKNLIEQRQKLRELYGNRQVQVDPEKITVTSIDQKFLEDLLTLLEENYSDSNFGVPEMQQDMAMSKTQLHRKLKALTNEAPGELLRNFRLKRAAQLLSQNADSVTQIAYQVGFNNLSYFAKCFKELYGVAPSSY